MILLRKICVVMIVMCASYACALENYSLNVFSAINQKLNCELGLADDISDAVIHEIIDNKNLTIKNFILKKHKNILTIKSNKTITDPVLQIDVQISADGRTTLYPLKIIVPLAQLKTNQPANPNKIKNKLLQQKIATLQASLAKVEKKVKIYYYTMLTLALILLLLIWFGLKYQRKHSSNMPDSNSIIGSNQSEDYLIDLAKLYIKQENHTEAQNILKRLITNPDQGISNQARNLMDNLE